MPTIKPNKIEEVISKIFKSLDSSYGLREFGDNPISEILYANEHEKGRYYIKDLKSGSFKFIYDDLKQTGKP